MYLRRGSAVWGLFCVVFVAALCGRPAFGADSSDKKLIVSTGYRLETGDQLTIHVTDMEDFDGKTYTLDQDGNMLLPLLGTIHVTGMSMDDLKENLTAKLKHFMKDPEVAVSLAAFRSSPVFLTGNFKAPGVFQMKGQLSLLQLIAQAGGLSADAGDRIRLTRRVEVGTLPLPHAHPDPTGTTYTAELRVGKNLSLLGPEQDIVIKPYDVIWADPASVVYVNGEVAKSGSQSLHGDDRIPISHLLAEAGGLRPEASAHVRILRPKENTLVREEIDVDLEKIFRGKAPDVELLPNDELYVPRDGKRVFWTHAASMAVPLTIPWMLGAF